MFRKSAITAVISSRFDRFLRDRFPADTADQNFATPPNSTGPGEFAGQNRETERNDDERGSWQNDQGKANQDNTEAKGADKKFPQPRLRFQPDGKYRPGPGSPWLWK